MKQDKDWIEELRSSLREAEPTPPAGGWERLESELGEVQPPRGSVWRIYWPRIAAAAAVLLCFVAGAEFLLREERNVRTDGDVIVPVADGGGKPADKVRSTAEPEDLETRVAEAYHRELERRTVAPTTPDRAVAQAVLGSTAAVDSESAGKGDAVPVPQHTEEPGESQQETQTSVQDSSQGQPPASQGDGQAAKAPEKAKTSDDYSYDMQFAGERMSKKPQRGKISVGLSASGGVAGSTEKAAPGRMLASSIGFNGNAIVAQKYTNTDFSYRHHVPLSFGMTVRKEFAHGLSLESGVNYTLLWSDVSVKTGSKDITQKLHFIGIPLRMNWQFLERGRFSLYIGAGGMFEKCVSAKFGSKSVEEPGAQWSVTAAAGAQYRLGGVVGLYFEPEASYYFTETRLRTTRTDSPLSATLRLGVRLSF